MIKTFWNGLKRKNGKFQNLNTTKKIRSLWDLYLKNLKTKTKIFGNGKIDI
jgi:hypothetical protein